MLVSSSLAIPTAVSTCCGGIPSCSICSFSSLFSFSLKFQGFPHRPESYSVVATLQKYPLRVSTTLGSSSKPADVLGVYGTLQLGGQLSSQYCYGHVPCVPWLLSSAKIERQSAVH
ncbi:hypothetical protein BDQ94DRAFT_141855 [Aspergillus welwitschiae]|uniref:Uncharacterized protein n=1 Tax=Aspergillus welwitschiae TaxID=1341132 RepID=A0A3F3Q629_9EURO|nr:hypothetical protein BDQ94DRAFT_141855 [Aspergillus welwitschiae]RDH34623.1 hypothetical protein BDQ94DRAFT_141855 [Aspergillus welwitschiae]